MFEELLFRILFLTIYGLFAAARIYYRRKAKQPEESGFAPQESKKQSYTWVHLVLFIAIPGMMISIIIFLLSPLWAPWFPFPLPAFIRWIGFILGFCSIPFLLWVHRTLGHYYSAELEIKDQHRLIITGPYARIRHPMYTTFIIFILATILLSANLLVILFGSLVILMFYPMSKIEEAMLLDQFGDEYLEYMKQTGRFFPRLRRPKENA